MGSRVSKGKWITGVIDRGGVSGINLGGPNWYVRLTLNPWRQPGKPPATSPLKLDMRTPSERAFERTTAPLAAGQVRRFRVGPLDSETVGLFEIGAKVRDAVLARAKPAKPLIVRDEVLGRLVLNKAGRLFTGKRSAHGQRYTLAIDASETGDEPTLTDSLRAVARKSVVRFEKSFPAVRRRVSRDLLSLYNRTWRDDEDPAISAKVFATRISLSGVQVSPDGSMDAYFADGGLFAGHTICVTVDARAKVKHATIVG